MSVLWGAARGNGQKTRETRAFKVQVPACEDVQMDVDTTKQRLNASLAQEDDARNDEWD